MEQIYGRQRRRSYWDRTWKDRRGRVVLWQTPNAFLIAWAVLATISLLLSRGLSDFFSIAGEGALIIWSLLEIFKGANYFRRALGLFVLFFAVASLIKSIQ